MDVNQLDVIAVGAHPDDCEIGCGGTLAKLARQGYRVGIVDLTDGEPTPMCDSPEIRLREAQQAADCLGIEGRVVLDLPNRRLFDSFDARIALARQFRRYRPRLVIGMIGKTPLASPDHWQAMQIIDGAIFYSRLSKWENHFEGLPVHSIPRQLYYSLNFFAEHQEGGVGSLVNDISETLELKLQAIRCYQTQFPPAKEPLFAKVEAMARLRGFAAGFEAGEVLYSPRAIGSQDLMKTLAVD
jgi:LmbE family N-acetylglucosaminyl deacetylase